MNEQAQACFARAIEALQQNNFEIAIDWLNKALEEDPANASMYSNRGLAWHRLGKPEQALRDYDTALYLHPEMALAHCNRAVLLMEMGLVDEAFASFRVALQLDGNSASAHTNFGNALLAQNCATEAAAHYQTACALDPENPVCYLHLGLAALRLDQNEQARSYFEEVLRRDPSNATAHCYSGESYRAENCLDKALLGYQRALSLEPENADAHFFTAVTLLALGQWKEAWPRYEWRWRSTAARMRRRPYKQPLWLGETNLHGACLLVHCEQGLGDTLQFARYLPLLFERLHPHGCKLVVEVPACLLHVLKTLPGEYAWVCEGEALPPFDAYCPLLSLPLALGISAPAETGGHPYLEAPQQSIQSMQGMGSLPASDLRRSVGIAWRGNPLHLNDRHRSMPLAALLDAIPEDWDIIALQTDLSELEQITLKNDSRICQLGRPIRNFGDTAALCRSVNLILSVDTSLVHLAGALGCPTWVLVPWRPDWRWGLHANTSPWYPSVQLHRQARLGDWTEVLGAVTQAMKNW